MSWERDAVICPNCHKPMARGRLYSPAEYGIYWLPGDTRPAELGGVRLSEKKIRGAGGDVLDRISALTFIAKDRPDSYRCEACGLYLTRWDEKH